MIRTLPHNPWLWLQGFHNFPDSLKQSSLQLLPNRTVYSRPQCRHKVHSSGKDFLILKSFPKILQNPVLQKILNIPNVVSQYGFTIATDAHCSLCSLASDQVTKKMVSTLQVTSVLGYLNDITLALSLGRTFTVQVHNTITCYITLEEQRVRTDHDHNKSPAL